MDGRDRQSLFLDTFGRPDPNQDPPCERTSDTTVVQALHLMNAPSLHREDDGRRRAGRRDWPAGKRSPAEIVEELYLWRTVGCPTDEERAACVTLFDDAGTTRRAGGRGPAVGADQHAGVRVQGLTCDCRTRAHLD